MSEHIDPMLKMYLDSHKTVTVVPVDKRNCTNCRWRDDEDGACHFNPPVVLGVENQFGTIDLDGYWPAVDEDGWCGKWEEDNR